MKVFITGVSSGLGLALAKAFLDSGDQVQGIARRRFVLPQSLGEFKSQFQYFRCDTTKNEQVEDTFQKMVQSAYIPDLILFCAGSATDDIIERGFRLEKYRHNFQVNLWGILSWIERFLPFFMQRRSGTVAAISSMSVYLESRKRRIGYSASRAALNKTFENLRLAYLNSGLKFVVFNMGRMQEKQGLIGISHANAAHRIHRVVKAGKLATTVNIPYSQYALTRMVRWIPEKIYERYLMKN